MGEAPQLIYAAGVKYKPPKMFAVVMHNDDYTAMDFVVEVIIKIFHKSTVEATQIMFNVHEKGKGVVGVYTYDIAGTKKLQSEEAARLRGFPLKVTIEEAEL